MSLMAITSKNIVVSNGSTVDYYDYTTHMHNILHVTSDGKSKETVTDVDISYDDQLLAVLLSKSIKLYELPSLKNIKSFVLPRSASKIRFGIESSEVFVADKTGDVLLFQLNKDTGTKLLGHLSLLLNVLQTNDGRYIITSDRDEKIKVSCYPNTYNIQTYCLGHKEFVNHIELLPHIKDYLTSASGDGTLKFWNYVNGSLLYTIDTYTDLKNNNQLKREFNNFMEEEINSIPIVGYTITKFNDFSSLIAVTVHSYMKVLVYQVSVINDKFTHNLVKDIPVNNFPVTIKFNNLSLFMYDIVDSEINEYKVIANNENISMDLLKTINVFDNIKVNLNAQDHNSMKLLFKRKFDNVQEYQEKKKQRLEKLNN